MLSHGATDMDNDNLMDVASHQGKVIAATHVKNKDKLRTAFAYRGAGFSSSSARNFGGGWRSWWPAGIAR